MKKGERENLTGKIKRGNLQQFGHGLFAYVASFGTHNSRRIPGHAVSQ